MLLYVDPPYLKLSEADFMAALAINDGVDEWSEKHCRNH